MKIPQRAKYLPIINCIITFSWGGGSKCKTDTNMLSHGVYTVQLMSKY